MVKKIQTHMHKILVMGPWNSKVKITAGKVFLLPLIVNSQLHSLEKQLNKNSLQVYEILE